MHDPKYLCYNQVSLNPPFHTQKIRTRSTFFTHGYFIASLLQNVGVIH
jgi:hypothetical protein